MPDRYGFVISVDTARLRSLGARLAALGEVFGEAFDVEMDEATQRTVLDIQERWPVDTGRSRGSGGWRGFGWQSVRRGQFKYTIVNPQPYTVYVLRKGSKRPKSYSAVNPDLQINIIVKEEVKKLRARLTLTGRGLVRRVMEQRKGAAKAAVVGEPSVPGSPRGGRGPGFKLLEDEKRRRLAAAAAVERAQAKSIADGTFIYF